MREIVLDTETTGLDADAGHRIIEIACLELVNHLPTGRKFHTHLNPERDVEAEAARIHGITTAMLKDKPVFASVVSELLAFIGDSPLVIHNAEFDVKFLNAEFARLGFSAIPMRRALDTVQLARRKFPGAPVSLDALCSRLSIDNSQRTLHGALLDAQLLSEVYLELVGGRQSNLLLAAQSQIVAATAIVRPPRPARQHSVPADELAAHAALVGELKNPIWTQT